MGSKAALRCPACNRLHVPIAESEARRLASACPGDAFEDYLHCSRCGTLASQFQWIGYEDIMENSVLYDCVFNVENE